MARKDECGRWRRARTDMKARGEPRRGRVAACGRESRGRDDGLRRQAPQFRRHEGADHRPRGPNIRALEHLTGVDLIIDDTPQAVVLSSFDGVRREVAKLTLSKLVEDGRIHPSRIEEMLQLQGGDRGAHPAGRRAGRVRGQLRADARGVVKVLGRLRYRTSYGQNILKHSLECAHLAGIMAASSAGVKTANRGAFCTTLARR